MKMVDSKEVKTESKENNVEYFPITDLPSNFKFYPKNTKILGRRLKVPEVEKLAELNSDNFNFVINSVLEQCIKGIDINELKIADKLYIIFWLRANTYREPGYIMNFQCPLCSAASTYEFELDNLEIIYLDKNYKQIINLDNNAIEVNFQSIKDQQELETIIENLQNNEQDYNEKRLELASQLGTINNKELALLDKYNFIAENLNPQSYIKLKKYIDKNDFGFKEKMIVKCSECGGNTPMGISFCSEFFIPTYKHR